MSDDPMAPTPADRLAVRRRAARIRLRQRAAIITASLALALLGAVGLVVLGKGGGRAQQVADTPSDTSSTMPSPTTSTTASTTTTSSTSTTTSTTLPTTPTTSPVVGHYVFTGADNGRTVTLALGSTLEVDFDHSSPNGGYTDAQSTNNAVLRWTSGVGGAQVSGASFTAQAVGTADVVARSLADNSGCYLGPRPSDPAAQPCHVGWVLHVAVMRPT